MSEIPSRVLIVDDDAAFAGTILDLLNENGYAASAVTHPENALDVLAEETVDVVLVDLIMPGTGGIELADKIKAAAPDTQVLILTGHGDLESATKGIRHGIFAYLEKGKIQGSILERAVNDAAHRARLLRRNREILAELQESNRLLAALHERTSLINKEPHIDRLLAELVSSAKVLCNADAARVLLFSHTMGEGVVVEQAIGDDTDAFRGVRLHADEGIVTWCVYENQAVLLDNYREDKRYSARCDDMPTKLPGFLCAPLRHGRVYGVLMLAGRRTGRFAPLDRDVLDTLARHGAVAVENAIHHERSINFFTHTSAILVSFLESVDIFYPGHSRGVATLADMVTRRLGMTEAERRSVHFAALLHDIGKIRIDPKILKTPNFADDEERRIIQQHPALGLEILKPIAAWEEILPIIHAHHERWDGNGYPRGLAGEDIPVGARVVAIADAFDAMTRGTPHSPRRTEEEALQELENFSGSQFDPKIARLFIAEYRQRGSDPRLTPGP